MDLSQIHVALDTWLGRERHQLPLWLPVSLGGGIGCWFALPHRADWIAMVLLFASIAALGVALGQSRWTGRSLIILGVTAALGLTSAWWRAERLAAPILDGPRVTAFDARILSAEDRAADEKLRYIVAPLGRNDLPARLRISAQIAPGSSTPGLWPAGTVMHLRARLMPPAPAMLPGGYSFARSAWFQQIGATGTMLDRPIIISTADPDTFAQRLDRLRNRIADHIATRLPPREGGIAVALAVGSTGRIAPDDAEAMRASGLAHLLSVSGLHITAVVGASMALALALLALSERLALRWPLPLISAAIGALMAILYTLLTGAEVPAVRSCLAALLVLTGMALGRRAVSLRLVATAAMIVLLLWPEALVGPSFQMSFAAIVVLVALHEHPVIRHRFERREEPQTHRLARAVAMLLLSGFAVELILTPIVLFHFHRAGLYGVFANILAIPLTTFAIMPLAGLALLLDLIGLGAPCWWLVGKAIHLLLELATQAASLPGSTLLLAAMPMWSFALFIFGGLWLLLWQTGWRWLGLVPVGVASVLAALAPAPDLIVTRDGRHALVRLDDGAVLLLRDRAGDFVRDALAESAGLDQLQLRAMDSHPGVDCSPDACTVQLWRDGRATTIGFIRSDNMLPWQAFTQWCAGLDLVIAPRRLPPACQPRKLRWDRETLDEMGGGMLVLSRWQVRYGKSAVGDHPWERPARVRRPDA
jgi:competence protein ComEC